MGDPNQDPFASLFNIDMSQYPNLTADFSFDPSDDIYQVDMPPQQLLQLPQEPVAQLLQLPQEPVAQLLSEPQKVYTPVNVNLLSFQPLPPSKKTKKIGQQLE